MPTHEAGRENALDRAVDIGADLICIATAIEHLLIATTNRGEDRADAYDGELFQALSTQREKLRDELFEMNGGEVGESHA